MKRPAAITVQGRRHLWSLPLSASEDDLAAWLADGLEVYAVEASIPE